MRNQLLTMLELQDAMNTKVRSNWRAQKFEWYRAIWVESAELLDHYGWKWWKKQQPDVEQVILELIDIWHFGLSDLLQKNSSKEQVAEQLQSCIEQEIAGGDFKVDLEMFTLHTLQTQSFDASLFTPLMGGMSLSFEQLFQRYVGKNVLNMFRQNHGYKSGTYTKVWQGREDNEHLVDILEGLDPDTDNYQNALYRALEERYPG